MLRDSPTRKRFILTDGLKEKCQGLIEQKFNMLIPKTDIVLPHFVGGKE